MSHHYLDDFRREPSAEPEPVRLWAETWIEIPSWEDVTIAPCLDEPRKSILTWPRRREPGRCQNALVSNIDLAGLLWP